MEFPNLALTPSGHKVLRAAESDWTDEHEAAAKALLYHNKITQKEYNMARTRGSGTTAFAKVDNEVKARLKARAEGAANHRIGRPPGVKNGEGKSHK